MTDEELVTDVASPLVGRPADTVSLEGRRFRSVTVEHTGDVDEATEFEYHESSDGTIWARYGGGAVRLGFLVGTRRGAALDFRYAHVAEQGETAAGHCTSSIQRLADGRLRMHETWQWESKPGSGESVIEEVSPVRSTSSGLDDRRDLAGGTAGEQSGL